MATHEPPAPSSGFQIALRDALAREWQQAAVKDHEFFRRWAGKVKLDPLSQDTVLAHCLGSQKANVSLIHLANTVAELDWPTPKVMNAVHRGVVEIVELMTLVLCERRILQDNIDQGAHERDGMLVLPMNDRLVASITAAVWLQCRVKLVLDDAGRPSALNVLTDLPPQEYGWVDVRQAARAEVMAYVNHLQGGDLAPYSAPARTDQLTGVKRQGLPGDSDVSDFLEVLADEGGVRPIFGLQYGAHQGWDRGVRVWLRDALGVESFFTQPASADPIDPRFAELQAILVKHLENIVKRVHAGADKQMPTKEGASTMTARSKLFISYAHEDESWRKQLRVFLKPLERKQLLDVWDDRRIRTGSNWRTEIDDVLAGCRIAVLLVSPYFLDSDFINDVELTKLFMRHKSDGLKVYPIVVSSCSWNKEPFFENLQIKLCAGKAFDLSPLAKRNEIFTEIAEEISGILDAK